MKPNWPHIRLIAAMALPVICASCVPARANTEASDLPAQVRARTEAQAQAALMPQDAEARERFMRKVAELLAPVSAEPSQPFNIDGLSAVDRSRSLDCLTAAIYYEARSEPEEGQRAVAQVVLNRVRHPAYPSTVCGVVYQGSERRTGCQFSFTCDGSMYHRRQAAAWDRSRRIAAEALAGAVSAAVGNATHYHTTAILPYWAAYLQKSAIVGSHIFYRWTGSAGEASAFRQRYGGLEPAPALVEQASTTGVTLQGGVAIHAGVPAGGAREQVSLDDGTVTIHRGGNAASRPVALASEDQAAQLPDQPAPAEARSFGVTVHHGIASTTG